MTTRDKSPRADRVELFTLVARVFMGALFVYMGMVKVLDPVEFLKLVREYDMVSRPFVLNAISATLPWFEVFCGLLLIGGVAVRGTALVVLAMLVPFTIIVFKRALVLQAEQFLPFCQVQFDCGCGGGEVFICSKLLENLGLFILGTWLLFRRHHRFCLRPGLSRMV